MKALLRQCFFVWKLGLPLRAREGAGFLRFKREAIKCVRSMSQKLQSETLFGKTFFLILCDFLKMSDCHRTKIVL